MDTRMVQNNLTWDPATGKYIPIIHIDATTPVNAEVVKPVDIVNHPPHYQVEGIPPELEVYKVIDAYTNGLNGFYAVCQGHVIRYILRWYRKNGLEDLKKARWYLDKLIELEERDG